jgi:hypothetical protein
MKTVIWKLLVCRKGTGLRNSLSKFEDIRMHLAVPDANGAKVRLPWCANGSEGAADLKLSVLSRVFYSSK